MTTSIRKILVGTDFSAEAEAALVQAIAIATRVDAEIVIAHAAALSDVKHLPGSSEEIVDRIDQLAASQRKDVQRELDALAKRCADAGISATTRMLSDLPDPALPEAAEELEADLVVVGTHGHTGVRRFLLGSVAERVVRHTQTDVLVARKAPETPELFSRILVPTDFSVLANRAIDVALALAAPGARIELLHSWALPATASSALGGADEVIGELRKDVADHASTQGQALIERYQHANLRLTFMQREDSPVHGVRKHLEDGTYDLVVMGSHGRRGLRRWILGSVAEATVRHAPCSVYVVHAAKAPAPAVVRAITSPSPA